MAQDNTTGTEEDDKSITGDSDQNTFDTSKLGDEDFAKVFEDSRLYRHPRFKNLNDKAKKAAEYEKAEEIRQADALKEQGKWEALANHEKEKAERAENRLKEAQIDNQLQLAATKLGAVDIETVLKLIDKNALVMDENGNVPGVEEAVQKILEAKPFLKKGNNASLGSGFSPASTTGKKFKLSQLSDVKFYQANAADIREAFKTGNVENDTNR